MMEKVRVSVGTAHQLGLKPSKFKVRMNTAYLLTYHNGRCSANCGFCAQARGGSADLRRVARGIYPEYPLEETVERLKEGARDGVIKRVCLQTINHPAVDKKLEALIEDLLGVGVPVTISRHPATTQELEELKALGVDRVTIPLDAVTEELFDRIKGREAGNTYTWQEHWKGLERAVEVFGRLKVGTHIIIGFGETEEEALGTISRLWAMGVGSGLFAFVPIKGTPMGDLPRPPIGHYRRIQLGYYLMRKGLVRFEDFIFEDGVLKDFGLPEEKLLEIVESGKPFVTVGCPNCNRPYSTEAPDGPQYNYALLPGPDEIEKIKEQLWLP